MAQTEGLQRHLITPKKDLLDEKVTFFGIISVPLYVEMIPQYNGWRYALRLKTCMELRLMVG